MWLLCILFSCYFNFIFILGWTNPLGRIVFSVKLSSSVDGGAGGDRPILFDQVLFSQPSGLYNSETGQFTAPVAGLYYFQTDCSSMANRGMPLRLVVNCKEVVRGRDNNGYGHAAMSAIQFLNEGSTVQINWLSDSGNGISGGSCTFTGFRLG